MLVLIVLHELGHYLAARAFGLKPQAFSVGMGPELAGFTDKHGTRWKIAPFPLGGYVKFHGEMHPGTGTAEEAGHPESFARLARWKRAVIIFAGPFTNLLICGAIFYGIFATTGYPIMSNRFEQVVPGSPAEQAGLRNGDRLISYNGNPYDGRQDFFRYIKLHPNGKIDVTIERDGERIDRTLAIAPSTVSDRFGNQATIGRVGINFDAENVRERDPIRAIALAANETRDMFRVQLTTLNQMVRGERSVDEISGPLRLARMSGQQASNGIIPLLVFSAILSCALAFMNLLPIPGLDGGYLTLYAIETAVQRDLSKVAFTWAVKAGIGCVVVLSLFALSNDIRMIFFA
ncbi:M50 family metallopeptidase [Sphingomonas sp. 3-13AW]|uniref:M50 family metallopeptidase n=1 Tax=Sphingomonas sp. 3-13AW TaxID=3050450 RepID=UPI003BB659D6